jgi:hypothetical protein
MPANSIILNPDNGPMISLFHIQINIWQMISPLST